MVKRKRRKVARVRIRRVSLLILLVIQLGVEAKNAQNLRIVRKMSKQLVGIKLAPKKIELARKRDL
jgi:hypothetical protein